MSTPSEGFQFQKKLTEDQTAYLLCKLHERDRAEAFSVIETDYPELLYDPKVHPVEIGRDNRLRFIPDTVKVRGQYMEKEYTRQEHKSAEKNDRETLKRTGYSLESYFDAPIVVQWCKMLQFGLVRKV